MGNNKLLLVFRMFIFSYITEDPPRILTRAVQYIMN